jgi:hypothetical protein
MIPFVLGRIDKHKWYHTLRIGQFAKVKEKRRVIGTKSKTLAPKLIKMVKFGLLSKKSGFKPLQFMVVCRFE